MAESMVIKFSLIIEVKHVLQRMGYREFGKLKPRIKHAFEAIYPYVLELLQPRAIYKVLTLTNIDEQTNTLSTTDACFTSKDLIRLFGHAELLVAFVATVGSALETEMQRRIADEDLLNAYFMDVIASEALIVLIHNLRKQIQSDLTAGVKTSVTRYWYCPGYGNWDVREQIQLFEALKKETQELGVRINNHCAMIPRKSYSGLFGVGYALEQDPWNSEIAWVAR